MFTAAVLRHLSYYRRNVDSPLFAPPSVPASSILPQTTHFSFYFILSGHCLHSATAVFCAVAVQTRSFSNAGSPDQNNLISSTGVLFDSDLKAAGGVPFKNTC